MRNNNKREQPNPTTESEMIDIEDLFSVFSVLVEPLINLSHAHALANFNRYNNSKAFLC